jgi:citronellol/citronellal dehydrogenase
VTGASRGIGRAVSLALARAGAGVTVAARSEVEGAVPGTIHATASAIEKSGGAALPVVCDVTDEASVEEAVGRTVSHFGGIDILVSNAGIVWLAPLGQTSRRRWDLVLRVNLTGVFLVTKAVVPHVTARGSGSLVAITTNGVSRLDLGSNAYWVSKAGVERLYAGLATELAEANVAVNCLAPSGVVMTEGAVASGISAPDEMVEDAAVMGRACVHLASQDASGITGGVHYSTELLASLAPGDGTA